MITSGVLLIKPDASRPRCFEVEAGSHPNDWMSVKYTVTAQELEKELSATGWTFFFMAGPIRTTAFGFDRDKTASTALKRGIQATIQQGCNCLQIEGVETHSFLGIPYISLSLRPRRIQKGALFGGTSLGAGAEITPHALRRSVVAR